MAKEISNRIKGELSKMGWSMNEFVKEYDKFHSYRSGLTIDSFKKQLARKTTNPNLLNSYLNFLYQHPKWVKLDQVRPIFVTSELDEGFVSEMEAISEKITIKIENDL